MASERSDNRTLAYSPGVTFWHDPAGNVFICAPDSQTVFRIDGIAAVFWTKLSDRPVDITTALLARNLGLQPKRLAKDIKRLVASLLELGLVRHT